MRLATDPASLKQIRASLGVTSVQMAQALNTPHRTYANWEQGSRSPPGCLSIALEWVVSEREP